MTGYEKLMASAGRFQRKALEVYRDGSASATRGAIAHALYWKDMANKLEETAKEIPVFIAKEL